MLPEPAAPFVSPGLIRRLSAIVYDSLLLIALLFVVTAALLPLNGGDAFRSDQYFYPLLLYIVGYWFFAWFWTHGGQTLGMKAWKLKLTADQANSISWKMAALRYLGATLSWLCLGLGFVWILFDKQNKAWHDYISNTWLIKIS